MTWEIVKIFGNLFNDNTSSRNSRNKRTTSNNANNNRQREPPSLTSTSQKTQTLRAASLSSTVHSTVSSQFTTTNDDIITQQLIEESELLYLQLPENVKSILDKLRVLQHSEKSILFDQQLKNGEWQSPFATLESAMMSILLLAPTLLLSNPLKAPLKDDTLPERFSSSRRASLSTDSLSVLHEISSSDTQKDFHNNHSAVNHNFYKNHKNNSSRSSYISSTTFRSDFSSKSTATASTSTTKNSSLCKVLSASSLLTCIIGTILEMHYEALITCFINRETLDYYHSLTGRVYEEADAVITQVHKIKSQVRYEEIASHAQNIYDKLIAHSNRLVDVINLFVNFVHKHLPVIYEDPLKMHTNEGQSNKKKKNTFGKKVIRSLTSFKRRSTTSIKNILPSDLSKGNESENIENITGHNNRFDYHSEQHNSTITRMSFEVGPQRIRIRNGSVGSRSVNSVDSNKSSTSMSVNYSKTTLPETPKARARKLQLPTLSRENRGGLVLSSHSNYGGHFSVPSSPSYSIKSNSRFKEQLDNSPSTGIPMSKGRRRLSDVSGAPPLRNSIYNNSNTFGKKSTISLVESGFKSNKDGIDASSTSRSRRSSNSSIKSYILKHVHSLSPKGKSPTTEAYDYWPVTEDTTSYSDLFIPHSPTYPSKSSNRLRAPSFSSKRHKLQKTNSETDLRRLKKMWTDTDNIGNENSNSTLHYLTPHVEDDGENSSEKEQLSAANDGNHNLREQLFRKLVTKKSSNSLNAKKKPYPSNLIKIPHVFKHSNEEGIVNSEVVQNMEGTRSFSNSLKRFEVNELCKDGLIIETIDGSPQILAGTLNKLLSRLVDDDEKDADFIDCFLLNHTFFISSESLLQELINRYRAFNSQNDHKNIISILYRWVTIQPQDFQIDATLRDSTRAFLTDEVTGKDFQLETSKIKSLLEFQSLISTDRDITRHSNESAANSNTNSNNIPRPLLLSDSSPLLEFESKNIAKYLTLMDFAVLKSITFFDITVWWRKRKALENVGSSDAVLGEEIQLSIDSHLAAFTRRSNMISHWIAHEICSLKTVKARRTVLHKFIETARYCREYNNFHIASCIALALNSRPVQRMVKTWESLSHQDIITSQSIEELIDPSRNMRKYRKSLASAKPPVIPFFAIFLKDLTFIIEGNPTYLRNKLRTPSTPTINSTYPEYSITNTPTTPSFSLSSQNSLKSSSSSLLSSLPITMTREPLINFEKFRFLTKNIRNIKRYTSESYPFANQLSRPPKILTSTSLFSPLFEQNELINAYNSLMNNNLNGNGSNDNESKNSNGGIGSRPAPLDHIGEVIERRMFAAAGSIFDDNVASIVMLDGSVLEAELMALSLEAEPASNVI